MNVWRFLQFVVVGVAAAAIVVPLPADLVERYFAHGFYPAAQRWLTGWSNETSVSLFDFLVAALALIAIVALGRGLARTWRTRSVWPLLRSVLTMTTLAATVYLWFLLAWGLNYARPPLEDALGYDASRVTSEAVLALAERATDEVNKAHAAGHAAGFPAPGEMPPTLVRAIHDIEQKLGRPSQTIPSRPKRSLFGYFFRASGVDGMHAPFLLETLLNPDLTAPERPAVLAHEWAHLAGYAPEDDASFVGLVAALRADPASRYSAWLALFHEAIALLPRDKQRELLARLSPGPQADRAAIIRRHQLRIDLVERASWQAYDRYLKSQGVREGIQNYSRVVNLLLGSTALDWQ